MHIVCAICSELVLPTENIFATVCGHIFHYPCLLQWIERSKTCPQCRNRVTENCLYRLFPTVTNETVEDVATVQSKLDNALLDLRQQKQLIKEKDDKLTALKHDLRWTQDRLQLAERKLLTQDSAVLTLNGQVEYYKQQCNDMNNVKEENQQLKMNLQTLNGLQKVLNSTSQDVEQMLSAYNEVRTVAVFANALKRALCDSESKKKEARDKLQVTKQALWDERSKNKLFQARLKQLEETLCKLKNQNQMTGNNPSTSHSDDNTANVAQSQEKRQESGNTDATDTNASLELGSEERFKSIMGTDYDRIASSPYFQLKQGNILSMLQRIPLTSSAPKPSEVASINSANSSNPQSTKSSNSRSTNQQTSSSLKGNVTRSSETVTSNNASNGTPHYVNSVDSASSSIQQSVLNSKISNSADSASSRFFSINNTLPKNQSSAILKQRLDSQAATARWAKNVSSKFMNYLNRASDNQQDSNASNDEIDSSDESDITSNVTRVNSNSHVQHSVTNAAYLRSLNTNPQVTATNSCSNVMNEEYRKQLNAKAKPEATAINSCSNVMNEEYRKQLNAKAKSLAVPSTSSNNVIPQNSSRDNINRHQWFNPVRTFVPNNQTANQSQVPSTSGVNNQTQQSSSSNNASSSNQTNTQASNKQPAKPLAVPSTSNNNVIPQNSSRDHILYQKWFNPVRTFVPNNQTANQSQVPSTSGVNNQTQQSSSSNNASSSNQTNTQVSNKQPAKQSQVPSTSGVNNQTQQSSSSNNASSSNQTNTQASNKQPAKPADDATPSTSKIVTQSASTATSSKKLSTSIFNRKPQVIMTRNADLDTAILDIMDMSYDGLGGHSKPDVFPASRRCVPKRTAKHKLKRPNISKTEKTPKKNKRK